MENEDEKELESYKKQRFKAEQKGNLECEARISNYIGYIYERYGEFETAVEEHERALRLREVLGRKIDIAVAFRTLGECYCKKKDYEKAHSLHEKYLSLARECDDLVEEQRALTTIGNTFLEQSNERSFSMKTRRGASKKAENVYLKSLEICDQLKATIDEKEFFDMKARNFYNLGLVYDGLENSDTSRQYLNKALSLCQKHDLLDMLYVCQKASGDIYLRCNKLDDAGRFLDEAYTTAKKLKNKLLATEALWLKIHVFIKLKKYSSARHLLKKTGKVYKTKEEEMSKILACYKSVQCMEKTVESRRKINKEDLLGRIPLYDKLGDCAVDLKMYDLAVTYYNKVLTASIAVNKTRKELIPTYISLAQTYSDCFQYDKAIVYYKKEIECYEDDNHEQICRSWLNIATYEEKNDVDYKEVQNSYVNAHIAAKKAGNRKLQCRALSCQMEHSKIHKDEKSQKKVADQLDHIKSKYNIVDMEYEEESQVTDDDTDFGDMNTEDEVEMSDLTESEEDEKMVVKTVRMARRNGKRGKEQKRNDFGETPLHRACIKGELKKVKQLIAEGHPVNVQDNFGWIPLHEAANNNWYDITKYLLQHGADINHRGGSKCQGMTPLIDAASGGLLDIVELLLKYGANALAKDDHQMTALDHLMKSREENGEVDRKTEIQFNNIVGMLREKSPAYRGTLRNKVLTQSKPAALVPESESYSKNLPTNTRKPKADKKRQSRNDVIVDSDSDSDGSLIRNARNKNDSPVHMDTENSYQSSDDYDQCTTDALKQAISKVGRSACRTNQSSQPKRNDFGETPLHRACIKGELQKVKQLIAEGHPVNVQDNSGWIPLHEAANNNWYDITKYLLQHGADINHRGGRKCQGMTPLIDAACVGWLDIVELLLKYGANALAKDDHQMTALDHLMKLREENGEVDRKTEIQFNNIVGMLREKTPVYKGTSRNKVLTRSKPAALVPESESYSQNLPIITRKPKADKKRQSRNDVIVDSDSDSDGSLIRNSRNKSDSPVHMDTENSYQSFSDDYDQCATDAYKQAISKVGRSACRTNQSSQPKSTRRTSDPDRPALIAEEEFIENDWLIDDLKHTKQKKVDVNGYLSTGNIRKRSQSGSLSPLHYPERLKRDSHSSQKKRIKIVESDSESESGVGHEIGSNENPRLTDITNAVSADELDNTVIGSNDVDVLFNNYDSDAEKVPPKQQVSATKSANNFFVKKNSQKQLKLTDFRGYIPTSTTRTHLNNRKGTQSEQNSAIIINQSKGESNSAINREKQLNNVIRVKVNVEGVLLLIPVVDNDGTKTFSWLAEEAATRYYKMRGVKLKLTLGKDGAHFSPEDLVSLLLVDNDLVECFVDSKDEQPPVTESYKNACSTLKTVCNKNVSMLLQSCEVSGKLCLGDLALRPTRFQPVVRAIQHQTCLRELDLKGNRICDTGLENLCKVLNTVPNLVYLGLACNDVTVEGLESICAAVSVENNKTLLNLTTLDLSHNPLYDGCLVCLSSLIRGLPQLTRLSVSSCKFSVKLFQNDRLQLTEALHSSSVQHFDVSYNLLGCVGVELFLKCQNPTQILSLDLSSTISDHRSSQVYRHIYNFASQDGCTLQDLKLCQCNLGTEDADFLVRLPVVAKHLQKLDLSENPKLTNPILQQLFQSPARDTSNLEEIVANECCIQSPLSVEFLDALVEKLSASVPLRLLEFTCFKLEKLDIESLTQVWKDKFEEFGTVTCNECHVKLSVSDSIQLAL